MSTGMSERGAETARVLPAVVTILAGIFLLDLMGVLIRILSATYPPSELAAFRNLFGLIPPALFLLTMSDWHARGRPLRMRQWWLAVVRGFFVTFAQLCFYLGLMRLEVATASTLAFAGPLFVTALSMPVLGERVGPWRWSAVLLGFAGVVLVMKPGTDAFTLAALLPVGAAFGYACASILVRKVDSDVPSPLVNVYSTLASLTGATTLMLILDQPVAIASSRDLALIAAMGGCGGLGVLCLTVAYRMVPPSMITPFEFTGILFAFALGWVFFDEAPFGRLFPGALLIVGGGLLIVWRERRTAIAFRVHGKGRHAR